MPASLKNPAHSEDVVSRFIKVEMLDKNRPEYRWNKIQVVSKAEVEIGVMVSFREDIMGGNVGVNPPNNYIQWQEGRQLRNTP